MISFVPKKERVLGQVRLGGLNLVNLEKTGELSVMKKAIALSALLGLSALGMACGETATNTANNTNRMNTNMNAATPMNTATPMMTPSNTANANRPMNTNMNTNANRPATSPTR
jgi:hypothetical protein